MNPVKGGSEWKQGQGNLHYKVLCMYDRLSVCPSLTLCVTLSLSFCLSSLDSDEMIFEPLRHKHYVERSCHS